MIPHQRFAAMVVFTAIGGLVAMGTAGCGPETGPDASSVAQLSNLPRWEGHDRQIFDDAIEPSAVGLSLDGSSPRSDPFLRERAQTAELVARVRVKTVTVDTVDETTVYHLVVEVIPPTFSKPKLPDQQYELDIRSSSPGYGIAKAFDARLQGYTFIGFIRWFAGEEEPQLHWHLSVDSAEVAAAVKEAVSLGELAGS